MADSSSHPAKGGQGFDEKEKSVKNFFEFGKDRIVPLIIKYCSNSVSSRVLEYYGSYGIKVDRINKEYNDFLFAKLAAEKASDTSGNDHNPQSGRYLFEYNVPMGTSLMVGPVNVQCRAEDFARFSPDLIGLGRRASELLGVDEDVLYDLWVKVTLAVTSRGAGGGKLFYVNQGGHLYCCVTLHSRLISFSRLTQFHIFNESRVECFADGDELLLTDGSHFSTYGNGDGFSICPPESSKPCGSFKSDSNLSDEKVVPKKVYFGKLSKILRSKINSVISKYHYIVSDEKDGIDLSTGQQVSYYYGEFDLPLYQCKYIALFPKQPRNEYFKADDNKHIYWISLAGIQYYLENLCYFSDVEEFLTFHSATDELDLLK